VTVGAGASLTVLGDGFSAASLGGGGTVKGDVTVPAGGEVAVTVSEDGSVSTLTVEGTLRLASGTLTLTGNPAVINPGKYVLLTADSLEKSAGEWSVPRHSRYGFSLSFEGDAAYLTVHRKGMMLICR
jgi:hypothetical protein